MDNYDIGLSHGYERSLAIMDLSAKLLNAVTRGHL